MQHATASASPSRFQPHFAPHSRGRPAPESATSGQGSIFGPAEMLQPHEQLNGSGVSQSQIHVAASQLLAGPPSQDPLPYKQLMLQV